MQSMKKIKLLKEIFTFTVIVFCLLLNSVFGQSLEEKQKQLEKMKIELEYLKNSPEEFEKMQKMYNNLEIQFKEQDEQKRMSETLTPVEYDKWKQSKIKQNTITIIPKENK